jgi:hypothetical protein
LEVVRTTPIALNSALRTLVLKRNLRTRASRIVEQLNATVPRPRCPGVDSVNAR